MASQSALYKQKNNEMLSYINELSKIEEELSYKLSYERNKKTIKSLERSIRIVSSTRENLVAALGSLSQYYTSNLENSSNTLTQQTEAVAIIDREMQLAKKRLEYVNKQKSNKLRNVEINQYYGASYREKTTLIKWILAFIMMLVLFYYLKSIFSTVSPLVYTMILTVIVLYFGYNIVQVLLSINARSRMVYDEYSWNFDASSAPPFDPDVSGVNPFKLSMATCIGEACCNEGTLWNKQMGICEPEVSSLTGKCTPSPVSA